ncbi:MAG: FkbM family methyltransferase [Candidatus Aenigmatarchaeota archaeon]
MNFGLLRERVSALFGVVILVKNWPTYLLDHFSLIKKPFLTYRLRNGIDYKVRVGPNITDRELIGEIIVLGAYNPEGFEIQQKDTVLDIGANIGIFSVMASKRTTGGIVYAFEPFEENFRMLQENATLNKAGNIVPCQMAVSGKTGRGKLSVSSNTACHSFYGKNGEKKVVVETISLDDFVKRKKISSIEFLKMDCEGSEYDILFNCSGDTLKKIKKISMEYHKIDNKRYDGRRLKSFLEKKGFEVNMLESRCRLYAKRL